MKSRSSLVPSAPPIFSVTYWFALLICFFRPAKAMMLLILRLFYWTGRRVKNWLVRSSGCELFYAERCLLLLLAPPTYPNRDSKMLPMTRHLFWFNYWTFHWHIDFLLRFQITFTTLNTIPMQASWTQFSFLPIAYRAQSIISESMVHLFFPNQTLRLLLCYVIVPPPQRYRVCKPILLYGLTGPPIGSFQSR